MKFGIFAVWLTVLVWPSTRKRCFFSIVGLIVDTAEAQIDGIRCVAHRRAPTPRP
jgi:hypothetical protein